MNAMGKGPGNAPEQLRRMQRNRCGGFPTHKISSDSPSMPCITKMDPGWDDSPFPSDKPLPSQDTAMRNCKREACCPVELAKGYC